VIGDARVSLTPIVSANLVCGDLRVARSWRRGITGRLSIRCARFARQSTIARRGEEPESQSPQGRRSPRQPSSARRAVSNDVRRRRAAFDNAKHANLAVRVAQDFRSSDQCCICPTRKPLAAAAIASRSASSGMGPWTSTVTSIAAERYSCRPANDFLERLGRHWFRQMRVETRFERPLLVVRLAVPADCDHAAKAQFRRLPQPRGDFIAIYAW